MDNSTALLIGAGETIELVARHLKQAGIGAMIVANRTLTRAQHGAGIWCRGHFAGANPRLFAQGRYRDFFHRQPLAHFGQRHG